MKETPATALLALLGAPLGAASGRDGPGAQAAEAAPAIVVLVLAPDLLDPAALAPAIFTPAILEAAELTPAAPTPAASQPAARAPGLLAPALPAPALRRALPGLGAALLRAARPLLRQPRVRQLALRLLKHFPRLYAQAYRLALAGAAAAPAAPAAPAGTPAGLDGPARATCSPRAQAILASLQALQARAAPEPAARPRLAFVSPLPPARTGVAQYALELLPHLASHFEIELIVAQGELALPASLAHLPVRQASWFAVHGAQYDQVLYQIGNSAFHSHMFALLARYPGVVVLHDFFIGGALLHAQLTGPDPHAWRAALRAAHGDGALAASARDAGQAHQQWPCSLPVLMQATRTIVHSQYARQLARDWFGPGAAARIDVIAHPRSPPLRQGRRAARAALGIGDDCFLVCSFGFVAPNKLTHELVRAFAASTLHAERHCLLVLVGANHDSPYGAALTALIAAAGGSARIRIAGWTDDAVYRQYLEAADLGVQLRAQAHGESSGAVLDCLNYGLPTIVNANGAMAAFPDDAVLRLADAFTQAELVAALETLRHDAPRRAALGAAAVALLDAAYRPAHSAQRYLATLAAARSASAAQQAAWRAQAAAVAAQALEARQVPQALAALATHLAERETPLRPRLLLDVSELVRPGAAPDALAQAQLNALLSQPTGALGIEPVALETDGAHLRYRQARAAAARCLGIALPDQPGEVIDACPGDLYYAFDAGAPALRAAFDGGLLAAWRARGVHITLLLRSVDAATLARARASADRLLCASAAIAQLAATGASARAGPGA